MTMMWKTFGATFLLAALSAPASAAYFNISVEESVIGVAANSFGSLDLSKLTPTDGDWGSLFNHLNARESTFGIGQLKQPFELDHYSGLVGDNQFYASSTGASYPIFGNYGFGKTVGIIEGKYLAIDKDYISGTRIDSYTTFRGETLSSLNLKRGFYTWRLGDSPTADTINISITSTIPIPAVPEPATWAMMLVGFGMVAGAVRYRRRSLTATYA